MYIPRWKRLIYFRRFALFLLIAAIIAVTGIHFLKEKEDNHTIERMNIKAIEYKTGGPLILYDENDNIIGFYLNEISILYNEYFEEIPLGIFSCKYNQNNKSLEIYNFDYEYFGEIMIDDNNIELQNMFQDSIMVVYDNL